MNFITGATGLVGTHLLLYLLEHGKKVKALYRSEQKLTAVQSFFALYDKPELYDEIIWVKGHILDIPTLEDVMLDVDYVYHCAAHISFDPAEHELLYRVNVEGTANVVNVALHLKIKKLCYVSSIAALGDPKNINEVVDEQTEWDAGKPHSDYALSKFGAEHEVFRAYQEGLDVVIVNPGVILGAGFWQQGSGVLFDKIAKGLKFYSTGQTGFVSAFDVVKIMYLTMNEHVVNERFIVISENKTFDDMAFKIADEIGVKRPHIKINPWLSAIGYKVDYMASKLFFKKRQLSRAMAKSMHSKEQFSNQKVVDVFQFKFQPIDEVITALAILYKKQNNGF